MSKNKENSKVLLSGIQPSGNLTIGHLSGALNNWVKLQEEFYCFFMIADLHTLTVMQKSDILKTKTLDTLAMYIACGIDPNKSVLFIQSHVPAHSELQWILSCLTGFGECAKMTQFKDKSNVHSNNVNVGLFAYPVLQAADILLYQANLVPVGEDQKQHLELARNIVQRFNFYYPDTFVMPAPFIPKVGAKIMSLQDPTKKMSKSDENEKNIIFMTDTNEQITAKIKRALTDSENLVRIDEVNKPGVTNLLTLYSIATNTDLKDVEKKFYDYSYGDFKLAVSDALINYIAGIRDKFNDIRTNKKYLQDIIIDGAEKANKVASKTLMEVHKKIGLLSFK